MRFGGGFMDLLARLGSYSLPEIVAELAVIWLIVFAVVRFLQGTRAASALKVILLLLVALTLGFRVLGGTASFARLEYLYDRLLALFAVALVVIFQPELRRGLIRLGEARLLGARRNDTDVAVEEIAAAAAYLAQQRMGALVVIEGNASLRGLVDDGTTINAVLSRPLLQTIFFPGTALHDLAVIVRGNTIKAAGVQLPLADPEEMPDASLGSRHRAAVGLTKECDALVVVVSEETGAIRLAQRGRLSRPYAASELAAQIRRRLRAIGRAAAERDARAEGAIAHDASLSGEPPTEKLDAPPTRPGEAAA